MALFPTAGNGQPSDPLQFIRSYLALAIQIGAPAFNLGDHRGCYEVYGCTARLLANSSAVTDEVKGGLPQALARASTVPNVTRQAWVLREAFDTLLDAPPKSATEKGAEE